MVAGLVNLFRKEQIVHIFLFIFVFLPFACWIISSMEREDRRRGQQRYSIEQERHRQVLEAINRSQPINLAHRIDPRF